MKKQHRRKFLFGIGVSLAAVWASMQFRKLPKEKKQTMKFLTEDGKLVEIDVNRMPSSRTAATKQDIQQWIKK